MTTNIVKPTIANSWIDLISASTVTSADSNHPKELAYDNDRTTYWESEGSNDSTTEVLQFDFSQNVDIDFIVLIGINLEDFVVQYWTGAIWATFPTASITGNADDYFVLKVPTTIGTGKVKFNMTTTIVPNQEKQIHEILLGEVILETWYDEFRDRDTELAGEHRLAGKGALDSWYEYTKRGWEIGIENKTKDEVDILRALKNAHESFIWYPEPEVFPDEVFLVEWTNPFDRRYSAKTKVAGSTIKLILDEK